MDLQLTWRGDYALRAAVALAKAFNAGQFRKIREVAEEMDIPVRYSPEILNILQRAGIAEARAGRQGGYRLAREPSQISFLEIVEASEGPMVSERCAMSGGPCHWQQTICAVHPMLEEAGRALTEALRRRTLADLLDIDTRLLAEHAAGSVTASQ